MNQLNYLQTTLLDLTYGNCLVPQSYTDKKEIVKLLDKSFTDKESMLREVRNMYYEYPEDFKRGYFDETSKFYRDILEEIAVKYANEANDIKQAIKELYYRVKTSPYRYVFNTDISKNYCFPVVDVDLSTSYELYKEKTDVTEQVSDIFYQNVAKKYLNNCSVYKILSSQRGRWYIFDYKLNKNQITLFNGFVKEHYYNLMHIFREEHNNVVLGINKKYWSANAKIFTTGNVPFDHRYMKFAQSRKMFCLRVISKYRDLVPCPDKTYNDEHKNKNQSKKFTQFTKLVEEHFNDDEVMSLAVEMSL